MNMNCRVGFEFILNQKSLISTSNCLKTRLNWLLRPSSRSSLSSIIATPSTRSIPSTTSTSTSTTKHSTFQSNTKTFSTFSSPNLSLSLCNPRFISTSISQTDKQSSTSILSLFSRNSFFNPFPLLLSKPIGKITPIKRPFPHRPPSQDQYNYNSNSDSDPSFRFLPVIHILVAINLIVFLAWQYAYERATKHRDPDLWIWMSRNFLSGQGNLRGGRWWTLISCCISQMDLTHFAVNMMSLYFTAPPILAILGPTSFLSLYFGAGITSSIVSMFWNQYIDPWMGLNAVPAGQKYSHGASGSVYAILTFFACLQPKTTFLLFFVVPVKAWLLVPGIFAYDIWNALKRPGGTTDSAGHVGGILFGLLFWRFRLRGMRIR